MDKLGPKISPNQQGHRELSNKLKVLTNVLELYKLYAFTIYIIDLFLCNVEPYHTKCFTSDDSKELSCRLKVVRKVYGVHSIIWHISSPCTSHYSLDSCAQMLASCWLWSLLSQGKAFLWMKFHVQIIEIYFPYLILLSFLFLCHLSYAFIFHSSFWNLSFYLLFHSSVSILFFSFPLKLPSVTKTHSVILFILSL